MLLCAMILLGINSETNCSQNTASVISGFVVAIGVIGLRIIINTNVYQTYCKNVNQLLNVREVSNNRLLDAELLGQASTEKSIEQRLAAFEEQQKNAHEIYILKKIKEEKPQVIKFDNNWKNVKIIQDYKG